MSLADSESSSHGGEHKFFRQASRECLNEMLGSIRTGDSRSTWKVLIMDKVTVKVMSHSCKMSDITDQGISLVEELFKSREPLPSMDAIYFIQPSKENVVMFLSDMSGREPSYETICFFSTRVPKELVNHIKSDTSMNLEYFPLDSQAFTTDHEGALQELYGENAENSRKFDACLNVMATRIATVFASLKEFPHVRYRAAKAPDISAVIFHDTVPTKLAAAVWNNISKYKSIPNFPQTETCELLILDRSVDQISPVINEWTYDAMCHDLLDMDGNKYVVEVPSKMGGEPEKKEVLLEDNDPVWLELRHAHIADAWHASERLHDKMTNFASKNKAAQMHTTRLDWYMQKIVQALPKYKEQVDKLSLHVEDASPENKLRLLMIYACVYPEKFEGDKATKLMQLARLSEKDMKVVNNMQLLVGSPVNKKTSSSFSPKFDNQKTKHAARKDRTGEEETWQLFRFYPVLEELIENVSKGELAKNKYSCMNEPSLTVEETTKKAPIRSKSNAPSSLPGCQHHARNLQSQNSRYSPNPLPNRNSIPILRGPRSLLSLYPRNLTPKLTLMLPIRFLRINLPGGGHPMAVAFSDDASYTQFTPDGKILAATICSTLQWLCVETGKVLDTADKAHDGIVNGTVNKVKTKLTALHQVVIVGVNLRTQTSD
ncbi:hypothetical protein GH714_043778 [Hevea brasiliensis]|uniref:Uncharacterized protein n=1 Tax=Hevea brasiliensis TaxID=3981 RepID=A0A6A6K3B0_HEVBR|nr:hypothetical protein GH714_043778 [Hevea brasiliensis]